MKKITFLIICLFTLGIACAQTQSHLKFMGISLDGTINQFQAKLASKGVTVDTELNKKVGVGTRAFKGTFSGKNAQIFIYYNEATKIVYRGKAVIESSDEEICESNYKYFLNMLSSKYEDAIIRTGEQDGHESKSLLIPNDSTAEYVYLGTIDVYRTSYYSISYNIHIDYTDTINNVKNDNRNMDDL